VTFTGKILTVVTLLLSVMFAAMAVTVFATHKNWKAYAASLASANSKLNSENQTYRTQINSYKERLKREQMARQMALAALETELAVANTQSSDAVADNLRLQQQVGEMTTKNQVDTALLATYTTENNGLKTSLQQEQLSRDKIFNSYVSTIDQLHENQGILNETTLRSSELAEMSARYKDIIDRIGPAATTAQELPLPLDGVVVAVGQELIEVSVGSDDGLKVGHTLDVFRKGGTYLGRVIVKKTLPDRSVAEILPEFRKGSIRIQDRVATRFVD